jgi:hypothetical protein
MSTEKLPNNCLENMRSRRTRRPKDAPPPSPEVLARAKAYAPDLALAHRLREHLQVQHNAYVSVGISYARTKARHEELHAKAGTPAEDFAALPVHELASPSVYVTPATGNVYLSGGKGLKGAAMAHWRSPLPVQCEFLKSDQATPLVQLDTTLGADAIYTPAQLRALAATLVRILAAVVGRANVAGVRTAHLHERFELWNYVGKTFLVGADVPGNFLMTEGAYVLKALVGKDVLTAEKKNGESVTIQGDFNVGLTSNSRLKVRLDGDTDAWRRRLLIINYERPRPSHPNPRFMEDLLASEASGILNWMVEGARMLLAEIRAAGTVSMTEVQRDRVDSLLAESDSVREFVRKGLAPCIGMDITSHEVMEAYMSFCESRGWNPLPSRKVESALPDAILEVHRVAKRNDILRSEKNQRGYRGLRALPIAGAPENDASAMGEKGGDDVSPFG